ncbi:MAG: hypothetical protein ABL984_02270 [Pyrinomonadaceae bacterium]
MAKTLLYRLFGIGKLPPQLVAEFRNEGVLFSDEGIRGTVTYKNFRGGGWRYSNWKRQWFAAAITLTEKRLVAYRLRHPIIDVALDDPRLKQVEFSIEEPETLLLAFDASWFQPNWTGRIEYRFRTPVSLGIAEHLVELS